MNGKLPYKHLKHGRKILIRITLDCLEGDIRNSEYIAGKRIMLPQVFRRGQYVQYSPKEERVLGTSQSSCMSDNRYFVMDVLLRSLKLVAWGNRAIHRKILHAFTERHNSNAVYRQD